LRSPMTAPKRRWFNFSLGALFVVTAIIACVIALELKIRDAQRALRERQAAPAASKVQSQ
jgi:hypothetical protein